MGGALEGIRVIDFGQYMAGPLAGMLLADQGADVIRVDPPGGPRWDTPANVTWNRNKRSIVLDLKSPPDAETASRLIANADVVIENFRPGVMSRLGLGAEALCAANPRLIYCSIPGFAADDPRAGVRAWEGVVGAASATYRPHLRTGRPTYTAIPVSSTYAAFQAALSVGIALNVRERDGVGQRIEVPLFDSTFAAMGYRVSMTGGASSIDAARAQRMARMVGGQLECEDERWVMYMGGNLRARDFLEATGADAWVDAVATGEMTSDELGEHARELFKTKSAEDWERFCAEIGTECGVCRTSDEWLDNEHALATEIIVDIQDPILGTVRGPGINVRMSETPGSIRSPRRRPDADRESVLADLAPPPPLLPPAPSTGEIEQTLHAALDGIKVIDLCIVLAGPTCGRTLAEFGADVIKVDSPQRPIGGFHSDVNRAKRSILLDLKTEEGLTLLWKLIADADVVVQNFRNGVADRLGFGYEAVHERYPTIVYASLNYAGQIGPYGPRPGHEQIAQAVTGMQARFGGEGKPALQPFAVNDYGTGIMGAYAVALALFHRRRTGIGQHVDTALAYTATMLQSSLIQRYQGKVWDEPRGQHALGSGPLHRAYAASDGWLFIGARPGDLARAPELEACAGLEGARLEQALEIVVASRTQSEWVTALTRAGIGVHAVVGDIAELTADPWVREHGLCITREHDGIGPVTTNGPSVRLSRTPAVPGRPAPKPGSDAASVMADLGMAGELERLVDTSVIALEFNTS